MHLFAAVALAFAAASIYRLLAPDFDPFLRAAAMAGLIVALDALVVAPILERSYAMFRSALGTWISFCGHLRYGLGGWTSCVTIGSRGAIRARLRPANPFRPAPIVASAEEVARSGDGELAHGYVAQAHHIVVRFVRRLGANRQFPRMTASGATAP